MDRISTYSFVTIRFLEVAVVSNCMNEDECCITAANKIFGLSESVDPDEFPEREGIGLSESMSKELSKYYKTLKKPIADRIVNKLKYIIGK